MVYGVWRKTAATYKGLQGTAWFQLKKEVVELFGEEMEGAEAWPTVNAGGHSVRAWGWGRGR